MWDAKRKQARVHCEYKKSRTLRPHSSLPVKCEMERENRRGESTYRRERPSHVLWMKEKKKRAMDGFHSMESPKAIDGATKYKGCTAEWKEMPGTRMAPVGQQKECSHYHGVYLATSLRTTTHEQSASHTSTITNQSMSWSNSLFCCNANSMKSTCVQNGAAAVSEQDMWARMKSY